MRYVLILVCCLLIHQGHSQPLIPEEVPGYVKTGQDFNFAISPNGDRIMITRNDDDDVFHFVEMVRIGDKWSEPKALELIRMAQGKLDFFSTASYSADGKTIYFHGNFQGSKGRDDIYYSKLINGQWQAPVNVGAPISTSASEISPSISPDGKRLYFTKSFPDEEKDLQIYYSELQNDGSWGQPVHWFPDLKFNHTENPRIVRSNVMVMYAKIRKQNDHESYLSVMSGQDVWTTPVRITYDEEAMIRLKGGNQKKLPKTYYPRNIVADKDFNYFYLCFFGNVYRAKVPESLRSMVNSAYVTEPEPENEPVDLVSRTDVEPDNNEDYVKPTGQYYALLIGNSDYQLNDLDLDRPMSDVDKLKRILTTNYQFENSNVITLYNADRNRMMEELFRLRNQISKDDNLLIFYAGHGHWDDQVEQGYWWPVDAVPDNPSNWLSNSDLREQIRGINSAHTLLVSDACFSGGIFKTRGSDELKKASADIQLLYRLPSRRAITSGTLSTVPDESVFFRYLLKYLEENDKKFLSSGELFALIRNGVLNNSMNVPQQGVILNTGDEGGDFIFIRK